MKVLGLKAENIKGLKVVEITPDGTIQKISGRNGQGKTSVLDSIWLAVGGSDALKKTGTTKAVRDGEKEGVINLDLGDLVVTRTFKADGKTTLEVRNAEGSKFNSPQTMLDALIGRLSFDPFSFSTLDDKEQRQTLLGMVELAINPDELDKKRKEIFDKRTDVNREVDRFKKLYEALAFHEDAPEEQLSLASIMEEMKEAQSILQANHQKRNELELLRTKNQNTKAEITEIEARIAELQYLREEKTAELAEITTKGKALRDEVSALVDPDLTALQDKATNLEYINENVRENMNYKTFKADYEAKAKESEDLTTQIQTIDDEKKAALEKAKFPIVGLGIDENGVTYNKVPFRQCSAAERLKVSMAMAMALNPKLRVIRIADGSLLDSANLKIVEEMARDKDYQVWVEIVDESGQVGIYIEDGEVKNV